MCRAKFRSSTPASLPRARLSVCKTATASSLSRGDRLNITQFQGNVGGGVVTASGGIVYRPQLRFDLAMAGKGVRVLYDQSIRTTLNSNLALSGSLENASLTGQVAIDQLSFTSDFDISDLMSQFGGDAPPPPTQGFSSRPESGCRHPDARRSQSDQPHLESRRLCESARSRYRSTTGSAGPPESEQRRPDLFREPLQTARRDRRLHQHFADSAGGRYVGQYDHQSIQHPNAFLGSGRPSAHQLHFRPIAAALGHHQLDRFRQDIGSVRGESYSSRYSGGRISGGIASEQPDYEPGRKAGGHLTVVDRPRAREAVNRARVRGSLSSNESPARFS